MRPRHWIVLGLFGLVLLGLLTTQVVLLASQKRTVNRQLRAQVRLVDPSVSAIADLRASARHGTLRVVTRDGRTLLADTIPLVRDLRVHGAPRAIGATGALAQRLLSADAAGSLADAARLARRALAGRLVEHVAEASQRSGALLRLSRRAERLQRRLLAIQVEALGILRQSLAIQRQTLAHAESIDRKTGGQAPPAPPVPTP